MNKQVFLNLESNAKSVAEKFSNKNREYNHNNETFQVESIYPMSDNTATVIFKKNTGKRAAAFFYHIRNKYWQYFFPKDDHILGMMTFNYYKQQIEDHNRQYNE